MRAKYHFRPKLLQSLATLLMLPLLIQLGLWQWHKAEAKRLLQRRADAMAQAPLQGIGPCLVNADSLRGRRVLLRGRFEAGHQILLDNQIHGEQAGYRVLTPLRIEGGDVRVLVDRGWLPLGRSRDFPPAAQPPEGTVEVTGALWEPTPARFLQPKPASLADRIWESVDLARFDALVPYPLEKFVVRLARRAATPAICRAPTKKCRCTSAMRCSGSAWPACYWHFTFMRVSKTKGETAMELSPQYPAADSGWRVVLLLGALFALPVVISAWLYFSGWHPLVSSAHGQLMQPPRQIGGLELGEANGKHVSLGTIGGRWTLLYFGQSSCPADCMRSLYFMRQAHVAQGREEGRIQRVFVARGKMSTAGMATLTRVFPGLAVVAAGSDIASRWPDGARPEGRIYLVDPLGNLVMRYAGDADPGGMRKDLTRLLAYSWVG